MDNKFSQFDSRDLNRKSATDILEKLRPIRQGFNKEFISRRLIWELIQNAKDNVVVCNKRSISNTKFNIEIHLQKDKFIFSHNYGFFRNENVRGLIRRYSSSDKDNEQEENENRPSTTGRFGTGFMTTHYLSERVTVNGVFYEDDVFSNFSLVLDRSGNNKDELIAGIEEAFKSVEESLLQGKTVSKPIYEKFCTDFIYELNENTFELAEISIKELSQTAAIALINHPIINEIKYLTENEDCTLKIEFDRVIEDFPDLNISIYKMKNNSIVVNQYILIKHEQVSIIIPVEIRDNQYRILSINPTIPKIFLDFPLVGTEGLNIPFIINSSLFEPNEERNGISLSDHQDKDTERNVKFLEEGFKLFFSFIKKIQDRNEWLDLYNLFKFQSPIKKEWIHSDWYEKEIFNKTKQQLLKVKAVENDKYGRIPLDLEGFSGFKKGDTVVLPSHSDNEKREKIWELAIKIDDWILPKSEYIHEWYEMKWIESTYKKNIKDILVWTSQQSDIESLSKSLDISNYNEIVLWLNDLLRLANEETGLFNDINNSNTVILPNQLKKFVTKKSLFKSDGCIEEYLKDVLEILGEKCRQYLLLDDVKDFSNIILETKSQKDIIKSINEKINLSKPLESNILDASNKLTNILFDDNEVPEVQNLLYQFSQILEVDRVQVKIKATTHDIWEKSNKIQVKRIINELVRIGNIESLSERLGKAKVDAQNWLSSFITFIDENGFENELSLKTTKILPNQNGNFCIKDDLLIDDEIDEELKDILENLGYKLREELLDLSINLKLPQNRERNQEFVADEISKLITPKLSEVPRTEETKFIFKSLYMWFNENREKSNNYFKILYENKHKLYDDEDVITSFEKAEVLDKLYSGNADDEELEKIIQSNRDNIVNILRFPDDLKREPTSDNVVIINDELIELHKDIFEKTHDSHSESNIALYFPEGEVQDFGNKLIELLDKQDSQWKGYIYHFSHIMNITNILNERKIKSRNRISKFYDSAGYELIRRSKNEVKDLARFYFRPKTPTQWHNEGLGQNILEGNPNCPIPIFLKFKLSEVIQKNEGRCYVSNGNLSTDWAKFSNSYDFLKNFDYSNVYKEFPDPFYKQASQQELGILNEFDFSDFKEFKIVCKTELERRLLLRIIDPKYNDLIEVNPRYYFNHNALEIRLENDNLLRIKNCLSDTVVGLKLNVILEDNKQFAIIGTNEIAIKTKHLSQFEVKYDDKIIYSTRLNR